MTLPILPRLPQRDFTLIRHGETTANRDAIIAGRLDVALTDAGRMQARGLAQRSWPEDADIFCSPMSRAVETARLGFPGRILQQHLGLVERNWGCFEGLSLDRLPPRDSHPEQGEAWLDMILRVHRALCDGMEKAGGGSVIFVCHSGVIRAARLLIGQTTVGTRPRNAVPHFFLWDGVSHTEHVDVKPV